MIGEKCFLLFLPLGSRVVVRWKEDRSARWSAMVRNGIGEKQNGKRNNTSLSYGFPGYTCCHISGGTLMP